MIKIQKISKDGLSKEEWGFTSYETQLIYNSYFIYNRNSKKEKWADERKRPIEFSTFCERNNLDEYDYLSEEQYKKYLDKNNPILQKTKTGKPKLSGICAQIKNLPKCPPDIAQKAALEFCLQLKVIYE